MTALEAILDVGLALIVVSALAAVVAIGLAIRNWGNGGFR